MKRILSLIVAAGALSAAHATTQPVISTAGGGAVESAASFGTGAGSKNDFGANPRFAPGSYIYLRGYNGPGRLLNEGPNNTTPSGYLYVTSDSYLAGPDAVNSNSTLVTETQATKASTEMTVGLVSNRIAEVSGSATATPSVAVSGANAGSADRQFAVWGRVGYSRIDDGTAGANWKGNLFGGALGADVRLNNVFLLGAALTYQYLDGDTSFNNGTIKDTAYGVSPYLAIRPTQWLGFDLLGGYSKVDKKRDRKDKTAAPGAASASNNAVTASPKSDRYFYAAFLNVSHNFNKLGLLLRPGVTHTEDKQKAYTEAGGVNSWSYLAQTTKVTQSDNRLQVSYAVNDILTPYAFGTYKYVMTSTKANVPSDLVSTIGGSAYVAYTDPNKNRGKNTFGGGLGLSIRGLGKLSGGFEGIYEKNKDLKVYGAQATIRYTF